MTHAHDHDPAPSGYKFNFPGRDYWKRIAIVWGAVVVVALIVFLMMWNAFFIYVPPGKYLEITANDGELLDPNEVLAGEGFQGVQREVKGEGWHFVLPILYSVSVKENTFVPPGKVGIVTAKGGHKLPAGQVLADQGEQGIQRHVLPPGTYRLNRHGYDVELVDATEIKPGYVGVLRRRLGKDGKGRFAEHQDEKGILRDVLQPGLYYINTKEFEVINAEVGIFQTSFHYDPTPSQSTAIRFTAKGGFDISLDCTIEWEVRPNDMPSLVAEYGTRTKVEGTVIKLQAESIGRDKGIDYGAQDFLQGTQREKFQEDFTNELQDVCKKKNVTVHSAFIRNIVIPEQYLKPIRDKQIAAETELTNKAKEVTAQSVARVEREQRLIDQRVAEVQAKTTRMVAEIDRKVDNVTTLTDAEIDKLKATYQAQIAALDAEREQVLGAADAQVTKLKETAKSNLYQLKMDVFQNDGNAFLRYSLAEQLNSKLVLRLFHSGPGTFWTNLEGKGMNLLLPAPTGPGARPDKPEEKR